MKRYTSEPHAAGILNPQRLGRGTCTNGSKSRSSCNNSNPLSMHRVAIIVSIVLRTVTPNRRSARKFFAAGIAISVPPSSTTTNEVSIFRALSKSRSLSKPCRTSVRIKSPMAKRLAAKNWSSFSVLLRSAPESSRSKRWNRRESTVGPHGGQITLPVEFSAELTDLRLPTQAQQRTQPFLHRLAFRLQARGPQRVSHQLCRRSRCSFALMCTSYA